jgi:hypothetical protein
VWAMLCSNGNGFLGRLAADRSCRCQLARPTSPRSAFSPRAVSPRLHVALCLQQILQ